MSWVDFVLWGLFFVLGMIAGLTVCMWREITDEVHRAKMRLCESRDKASRIGKGVAKAFRDEYAEVRATYDKKHRDRQIRRLSKRSQSDAKRLRMLQAQKLEDLRAGK